MKTWMGSVCRVRKNFVTVKIESYFKHPKYGKYIKISNKYSAMDNIGCVEGDKVKIAETVKKSKTISKTVIERLSV